MHDIVIRGGTIVDGTGAGTFTADVAIRDGTIVELGRVSGPGREVIDADGALVTPGFIDIHTHYDGQFIWDDELEPSFSNGTTTAIAGNCGVGFAPARKDDRKALIELMEGVEDIPGIVLNEGLDWNWTSFPEYLDRLAERKYTIDVASHLPHAPLRVFVMGERALRHEPATVADIEAMQRLVREAMAAGALGVSASRILEHLSSTGEHVPGTFAQDTELLGLASAMGESGRGVFQIVPLGGGGNTMGNVATWEDRKGEHDRFVRIARISGRPVTYLLHSYEHAPEEWAKLIDASVEASRHGPEIVPQVAARGLGLLFTLDTFHIFLRKPSYLEIAGLPRAERAAAMRDPARRERILSEPNAPSESIAQKSVEEAGNRFAKNLHRFYVIDAALDYEPDEAKRLDVIAERTSRTMQEVLYDTLSAGDGKQIVADFIMNYVDGGLDSVYEMMRNPGTVSGLGDGGAHLQMICDSAMTTFHLSFWSRDRTRGPKLPVETMVNKLTGKASALYGLDDRGVIAPGKRADLNVIDFDRVGTTQPEVHFDLPMGGARLLQQGQGYLATMVGGSVTRRNDEATGARPGRLIRAS